MKAEFLRYDITRNIKKPRESTWKEKKPPKTKEKNAAGHDILDNNTINFLLTL